MAANYAQSLGDYVAQQRTAATAAADAQSGEINWRDRAYGEGAPPAVSDWDLAAQWGAQQTDPMLKGAFENLMSGRMQSRGDSGDEERPFDASALDSMLDSNWRDQVYSGATGLDMSSASDRIKNAYKLREQIIAANAPYAGQVKLANKAGDDNAHYGSLALQLADRDITDLSQLQYDGKQWSANGRAIGALNDAHGHGWTDYQIQNVNGKPVFTSQWKDSSDKGKIVQALSIASMFVPGLGPALGSALGATGTTAAALGGGLINGALTAAGGGDFLKGALSGALGGGLAGANFAGSVGITDKLAAGAFNGAAKSALSAAVNGKSIQDALLGGALSGGLGSFNAAARLGIDNPLAAGAVNGALGKAAGAIAQGKDVGDALKTGALGGAAGGLAASFDAATLLGVTDPAIAKVLNGLVGGAIRGAAGSAASGKSIGDGLRNGAIDGGLEAFNPAAQLGVTNKDAAGLINGAINQLAHGKNPRQVLKDTAKGSVLALLKAAQAQAAKQAEERKNLPDGWRAASALPAEGAGAAAPQRQPASAAMQEPAQGNRMTEEERQEYENHAADQDWPQDAIVELADPNYSHEGSHYNPDNSGWLDPSYSSPVNADGSNYSHEGEHYKPAKGGLDPVTNSPVNTGGADSPSLLEQLIALLGKPGVTGTGKGGSTDFSLGKDTGGTSTAAKDAKDARDFQKEMQERQWAREDALDLARRKRLAPVSTADGLTRAAIRTFTTGA